MYIFPASNLLTTEFTEVKAQLSAHALMPITAEQLLLTMPVSDFGLIMEKLHRVSEFRKLIDNGDIFPSENYTDISRELSLLKIDNSVLSGSQCMRLRQCLHVARLIISFFENRQAMYPQLQHMVNGVVYDVDMEKAIDEVFDNEGAIKSTASEELQHIRKSLMRKRSEADKLFQSLLNKYRKAGYISDTEETMRNGRRVIAIVAEQKRMLAGVVHDISATGKTAYLEPDELVPLNNALQGLENEERAEIQRILRHLTSRLRIRYTLLHTYFSLTIQYDFVRASAFYAVQVGAHMPSIVNTATIDLKDAVHPLLAVQNKQQQKNTIPFSLYLRNKNRIMVISGPNAGGKTVCMKTVALLQMMLQSGFLITAAPHSECGLFNKLLIDIGDSQSIEYELSTYSSRLQKMNTFIAEADASTMFIIDEFGTGTDPTLGGALAEAVLEKLNTQNCIGIITTHFINLKVLADKTEGLINGCMLFDPEKLEPKYKLVVGKPGSSYTFLVAERSGMPQQIIKNAQSKVSKNHVLLENMLRDVETQKQLIDKKTKAITHAEKALDEMLEKYSRLTQKEETSQHALQAKLKQAELRMIAQFDSKLLKFVNDYKNSKDKKAVLLKYQNLYSQQKKEIAQVQSTEQLRQQQENMAKLKPGIFVHLIGGKTIGMIDSMDAKKAIVIFNGFKTQSELKNLIPLSYEDVPETVKKIYGKK